jgi:hypothetical protein
LEENAVSVVRESIDVDVPLHSVYNQWTQFEDFPHFMEGVEEVRQIDDRHSHWRTKVAGARREFDTEIVDQLPDERISWRSVGGDVEQKGVVSFQRLDDAHTRVSLVMDFAPHGMAEKAGDMLGVLDRRVKGDLKRFKGFIEEQDGASGAWRGRITPADAGTTPAGADRPGGKGPDALGDAPVRETPQSRMTGEGAPPAPDPTAAERGLGSLPADPDDMRHG